MQHWVSIRQVKPPRKSAFFIAARRSIDVRPLVIDLVQVPLFMQRTKPLRGGEDRELDKRSASVTRLIGSDFARRLYQGATPCYPRAWRRSRAASFSSFIYGRPAPFPARAPYPSIQSTLKQRPCQSRLRPPRLYTQGRRGRSEAAVGHGLAYTRFCRTHARG